MHKVKVEQLVSDDFEIKSRKPKILFWDIENSPNRSFTWGKWQQNVIQFDSEWYLLSFSVKWLGGKQITRALPDYEGYKPGSEDDKALVAELWGYLNESDILVAHNGDRFDTKKVYTKFIEHGLMPPEPSKSVDTLKVARRRFAFNSNKLDDLGRRLGVGRKLKHRFRPLAWVYERRREVLGNDEEIQRPRCPLAPGRLRKTPALYRQSPERRSHPEQGAWM